jgi:hypothetical protein
VAAVVNKYDVFVFENTVKGSFASSLDFEPGIVVSIEVQIPKGHAGKTGIQIWYNEAQLVPRQDDKWFTGNGTKTKVELDDPFPGGLGWRAEAYNLGKRPHTFWVIVETDPLGLAVLFPPVLLLRQAGEQTAAV